MQLYLFCDITLHGNIITVIAESPEVVVSGEGSGVAGTSYTLTCTVTLPSGVVVADSLDIQWLGLPTPRPELISPGVYIVTLDIMLQNTTRYTTCTASYTVNGVSSKLVQDRIDIGESMCPLLSSISLLNFYSSWRYISGVGWLRFQGSGFSLHPHLYSGSLPQS